MRFLLTFELLVFVLILLSFIVLRYFSLFRYFRSLFFFFFFLMIRRPPRSPLFPYPTLSRSLPAASDESAMARAIRPLGSPLTWDSSRVPGSSYRPSSSVSGIFENVKGTAAHAPPETADTYRSEEHTSELQSLTNLVCRLLLE